MQCGGEFVCLHPLDLTACPPNVLTSSLQAPRATTPPTAPPNTVKAIKKVRLPVLKQVPVDWSPHSLPFRGNPLFDDGGALWKGGGNFSKFFSRGEQPTEHTPLNQGQAWTGGEEG